MKTILLSFLIVLGGNAQAQSTIKAKITEIAIEEVDGSNSPFMEIVDSTGASRSIWFELGYSPLGTELMIGENRILYCTPEELQIGDNIINRCYYTMNEEFQFQPTGQVIIHYTEEKNGMGDPYWVIDWIESLE